MRSRNQKMTCDSCEIGLSSGIFARYWTKRWSRTAGNFVTAKETYFFCNSTCQKIWQDHNYKEHARCLRR